MLTAESYVARSQRRQRRLVLIVLAVAVGAMAAVSMSLIAGSRRSSSVVERFFDAAPRYDVAIFSQSNPMSPDAVRALPDVEQAVVSQYLAFTTKTSDGITGINGVTYDFSIPNPTVRLLTGRLPGQADNEIVVNESFVSQFGLTAGDTVPVQMFAPDQYDDVSRANYVPRGPEFDLQIVGVVRTPNDIATDVIESPRPDVSATDNGVLVPTQFWEAHHDEFLDFGTSLQVWLHDGPKGVGAFVAEVRDQLGIDDLQSETYVPTTRPSAFATPVDLETTVLLAVGIGAAIGAAGLALLLLRLQQRSFDTEQDVLRSMGMTSNQLSVVGCRRVLPAVIGATLIACAGAIVLSGRFPIGLGRELELDRGIDINVAVIVIYATAMILALLVAAALMPRTVPRAGSGAARPHPWASNVGKGAPFHLALGAGLAIDQANSRRRLSSSIGLVAAALAVATALGVAVWVSGTDHLYGNRSEHGWVWDLAIGNPNFDLDSANLEAVVQSPYVRESTTAKYGQATIDDVSTELLAFDVGGSAPPSVIRGRLPSSTAEIALGAGLMRSLHADIGDSVTLDLEGSEFAANGETTTPLKMTVVGESVAPVFGESDIADVGVLPLEAIEVAGGDTTPSFVFVNVAGPDRDASIRHLLSTNQADVKSDVIPSRIVNMQRVRSLPIVGLLLAAALGIIALITTIVTSARSNRRTLAVLAALGLDTRGERRALGWQGVIVAGIVLAVGIPVGLLAGAQLWRRVADDVGVRGGSSVSPTVIPSLVVAVTLVAIASAMLATRRRHGASVAATLHSE